MVLDGEKYVLEALGKVVLADSIEKMNTTTLSGALCPSRVIFVAR
jgi:hypothetical protein